MKKFLLIKKNVSAFLGMSLLGLLSAGANGGGCAAKAPAISEIAAPVSPQKPVTTQEKPPASVSISEEVITLTKTQDTDLRTLDGLIADTEHQLDILCANVFIRADLKIRLVQIKSYLETNIVSGEPLDRVLYNQISETLYNQCK